MPAKPAIIATQAGPATSGASGSAEPANWARIEIVVTASFPPAVPADELRQVPARPVRAPTEGEGRGAASALSLPPSASASAPVAQPNRAPAGEPRGSGRILVVDDNTDAAQTLAELLQVLGYEARTAPDAGVALQVLDEFRPQLALLDIGLPQVDGYELAGLIRQQPEGRVVRLVALTGYAQESDRARALAAQFDEHLVKPVGIDRLTEVLQRFL